jgi:transmembrane sensor
VPVDWEALARYLSGASSDEESEALRQWLAAHPHDADLVGRLDAAIQRHASTGMPQVNVESAFRRVLARQAAEPATTAARGPTQSVAREVAGLRRVVRWNWPVITAVAATMTLAVGLGLWRAPRRAPARSLDARTFVAAVGARDSLTLPDGSRVILGPGSRLQQVVAYGELRREVLLDGEAYFDVIHEDRQPFIVRAGAATIYDVGTTFSVRSDDGDVVSVVVTSGTVRLSATAKPDSTGAVLQPGDLGTLRPNGDVLTSRAALEEELAWTQGRLAFRDAPLPRVFGALRRWYGITLVVADTGLASRHLTLSFDGEPRDRVLHVVGLALDAELEARGDTVMVRQRGRGAR